MSSLLLKFIMEKVMNRLTEDFVKNEVADSDIIFERGVDIYEIGLYSCTNSNFEYKRFIYEVDGNYGDYIVQVKINDDNISYHCDCPYPGEGCKHLVAVLLDIKNKIWGSAKGKLIEQNNYEPVTNGNQELKYLTFNEIKQQAIKDREKRGISEQFILTMGETYKGEHLIKNNKGKKYSVTIHNPNTNAGHCNCLDYLTNKLGTCKHIIHTSSKIKKDNEFKSKIDMERFPFVDIYLDSETQSPKLFVENKKEKFNDILPYFSKYFDQKGIFIRDKITDLYPLLAKVTGDKRIKLSESLIAKLEDIMFDNELDKLAINKLPSLSFIKANLYPYQKEGVQFALYKKAALIGDEMGLGKTVQAIVVSILKKQIFGFKKVLIITPASLKEQWKREIEKFTDEKVKVIFGNKIQRQDFYMNDSSYFKITNYEAVLRDYLVISRYKPDLVILDEAQRIKNFETKTAEAVKSIKRKHSLVLTGTPLENKLEDVYSIIQFLNPNLLSPLWKFAAEHFMLSRDNKRKIQGYTNINDLHKKLKSIVIRRKKEEVLKDLPEYVSNNYYLDLSEEQAEIHAGYSQSLLPIINKKFLTPMDIRRIQQLLLCMRMVCDSTYLIDRKTNISPKLKELKKIVNDFIEEKERKIVIFSEWTTMNYLIAKYLSNAEINYVELSGKVPVQKRQMLIDEFSNNPDCRVFLSSDAGGVGLNLQAADVVINFELPWNPAKLNQRIGRIVRIGQKSKCINVVNLITKSSIEERVLAGIKIKDDLFSGVFDGTHDEVEFSQEKRCQLVNSLREMLGNEKIPTQKETKDPKEIPEDAPFYLNPEVLNRDNKTVNYTEEEEDFDYAETGEELKSIEPETQKENKVKTSDKTLDKNAVKQQSLFETTSHEQVEEVLNKGMEFINGLIKMATGKTITSENSNNKMLTLDHKTGEVTMKFKLPDF